jgi:hypothetical protein
MFNFVIAALLQLSFFMLAEAAPVSTMSAKPWQAGTGGGIVGFIVLVLDIIAWSMSPPCSRDALAPTECHWEMNKLTRLCYS